jgi:hypothetical protein
MNTTHSGEPWKGPFPSLNPLPAQASPWNLTVGSLLVCFPVPYSLPLIGSLPLALALLILYKPSISLPCHFSPGRWRQYVSPKCQHRPTYQHGTKTQKLNNTIIIAIRTLNLKIQVHLYHHCHPLSIRHS